MARTVLFFVYSNRYICANRISGARRYAKQKGWHIQVIEHHNIDIPLDVKGIIDFWKPIGVIAECGGGMPEISSRTLGDIPLVYLDENPRGEKGEALYVTSNSTLVGEIAARELLALDIPYYAFVGWKLPRFWSEERRLAFSRALKHHGRECCVFNHSHIGSGADIGGWIRALPKPCGVFAVHDSIGEEILAIADSAGIAVPEELAVVGVDDDPIICEHTNPTMTSIRLDFEQGGFLCAQMLDRRIHDPQFVHAEWKYEPISVTRRQSTRKLLQMDSRVVRAVEFIRCNACYDIGTGEVAAEMGVSRRMAEKLFSRAMGRTIHDEFVSVRMRRVESLLLNDRQDIGAIAQLCGWKSGAALRKVFKDRHGGLSMRQWREASR